MAIHSCSLGAPISWRKQKRRAYNRPREENGADAGLRRHASRRAMERGVGSVFELDPTWTDEFFATAIPMYKNNVLTPKEVELLSIAFDASYTHMYAPVHAGTSRRR